ncbi:MAG TPA: amidohydrolase family protein [Candidatus Dormibacteraeota bacterium]|nr:amidohydrolase family protein [Candidatus Dormibacteraeota bacterium]
MTDVETESRRRTGNSRLEDLLIVDADVHVHDTPRDLIPYCDMPWRVSLENIKDAHENYLDIPNFSPGGTTYQPAWPTSHEKGRTVLSAEQMRRELDAIFVDIAVLFPDNLLKLPVLAHSEYAAAIARAYNAWIVDQWCRPGRGLLGCLVACPQEPEDAAAEIRKYARHPGIVGVYLPCAGVDPLWGHKCYDPIYGAAEEAGLPVLLHSVTVVHPVFPHNTHGFATDIARHTVSHTFAIMANVIDMITTGVPVRFPNLRVAVTESGISWVPFVMNRLDKEYLEKRREVPYLTERPSHYLRRFYYATQPIEEPENLRELVTLVDLYKGEDQTVFASDWPHHDFDHPTKLLQVPFPEEVRRKIFGENALRLFRIDSKGRRLDPEVVA